MVTISATEARNNIGKLWKTAAEETVVVEAAGKPIAVVLSPEAYEKLISSPTKPRRFGFGAAFLKDLDVEALLDTDISEDFAEYM
jgi:prevent-host-death family protein